MSKPIKIELRRVHFSERLSEETNAYAAEVYVDGKHVVSVQNDGHGGCDMQRPIPPFTHADLKALNARIAKDFPHLAIDMSAYGKDPIPADLEMVCNDLLQAHLVERDVKRALKSKVVFVVDGVVRELRFKGMRTLTPEALKRGVEQVTQKYPKAKILNTAPLAEAVAAFRGQCA